MIIDIIPAINGQAIFRPVQYWNIWRFFEMMESAFPNRDFFIVCAGGYENAIMFDDCTFESQCIQTK